MENSGNSTLALALALALSTLNKSLRSTNSNLCIGIIKSSPLTFSTVVEGEKLIRICDDTDFSDPVVFLYKNSIQCKSLLHLSYQPELSRYRHKCDDPVHHHVGNLLIDDIIKIR